MRLGATGLMVGIGVFLLYAVRKGYTKNFQAAWAALIGGAAASSPGAGSLGPNMSWSLPWVPGQPNPFHPGVPTGPGSSPVGGGVFGYPVQPFQLNAHQGTG